MVMKYLQRLGRSLMVPVAVLPAAALFLGIGYGLDQEGWGAGNVVSNFLVQTGDSILGAIPLLFAVGIAFGMSKDKNGAAALAGLVGFVVITTLLSPGSATNFLGELSRVQEAAFGRISNVLIAIISGCTAAALYNKFSNVELPNWLAFFSGRRFVPIVTAGVMSVIALIFLFIWPPVYGALLWFGEAIVGLGAFGAALYGFFNRLLIPTGLHHALNSIFWFDWVGINDLGYFWGGLEGGGVVGETGRYMAGFFPVMMFGLPGACLAMYRQAKSENKRRVYGLMLSAAITSFVTGVTEPVEFSFMFLAPALYVVHAALTGISMFFMYTFQWLAGFAFSAGAIDLFFSSFVPFATNWFLIPVFGVLYFFVYFFLFTIIIKKFDLKTPGREDDDFDAELAIELNDTTNWNQMAHAFIEGLGGAENIVEVDNCATRVRLEVKDTTLISDKKLRQNGAAGVIKPSKNSAAVVVGPKVQFVTDEIKKILGK